MKNIILIILTFVFAACFYEMIDFLIYAVKLGYIRNVIYFTIAASACLVTQLLCIAKLDFNSIVSRLSRR